MQLDTFSIVARCPKTAMFGEAVSTAVPDSVIAMLGMPSAYRPGGGGSY